jgi:hypothetical protein
MRFPLRRPVMIEEDRPCDAEEFDAIATECDRWTNLSESCDRNAASRRQEGMEGRWQKIR